MFWSPIIRVTSKSTTQKFRSPAGYETRMEGAMWHACGYVKSPTVPVQLN